MQTVWQERKVLQDHKVKQGRRVQSVLRGHKAPRVHLMKVTLPSGNQVPLAIS